ncbi:transposase [Streptomyces sp. NBC_01429]|uniref:transposase n=1 Tax=Streptomyces sp. NBC_01429 TaxID=2903862 RepID=UPI003FCC36E3
MVVKDYPPEFKADAVALYESRPDATIRSVAADLGINPETLRNCVRRPRWRLRTRPCGRRSASSRRRLSTGRPPAGPPEEVGGAAAGLRA